MKEMNANIKQFTLLDTVNPANTLFFLPPHFLAHSLLGWAGFWALWPVDLLTSWLLFLASWLPWPSGFFSLCLLGLPVS